MLLPLASWAVLFSPALASSSLKTLCSPLGCVSTSPSSLSLGGHTSSQLLLPGTYSDPLPSQLSRASSLSLAPSDLEAFPNFTVSSSSSSLSILPQQALLLYHSSLWSGQSASILPGVDDVNATGRSLLLGEQMWAKLRVGGAEQVIWTSVRDLGAAPFFSSGNSGKDGFPIEVVEVQSSSCATPCSSGGSCSSSAADGSGGKCVCKPGFEGPECAQCATGFFGPTCTDCASSCASKTCDDGIAGSGFCVSSTLNSTAGCNCANGECTSTTASNDFLFFADTCRCSPGWISPTINTTYHSGERVYSASFQQCSLCDEGFFKASDGLSCQVCSGAGVATCADSTGKATSCEPGWSLDASGACQAAAGPSGAGSQCAGSNFFNAASASCQPCSPTCSTCLGSSSDQCLSCPSGQALLLGQCVDLDSGSGRCDSSTITGSEYRADGEGFFLDNAKGECDSCPTNSISCRISSFSSASTRSDVRATSCVDGYVVSLAGKCVPSCPTGEFVNAAQPSICTACDSTCGSCMGQSTYCLTCSSPNVALAGSCHSSTCPTSTIRSNGTCTDCHPDCASCSGTSFNECSSCPPARPVLKNGRCLPVCGRGEWFDSSSGSCSSCDSSCSSCVGSGPSNCLACSASDHLPVLGTCQLSGCTSVFVPYLQICLSSLVSHSRLSALAIFAIVLALLILLLLALYLYVRRERRKTREATRRFASGLEERTVVKGQTWDVEGLLGAMARARDAMERRWRESNRRKKRHSGGLELDGKLKPFKLGTGWQGVSTADEVEFDRAMDRKSTLVRSASQQGRAPPAYTPSFVLASASDSGSDHSPRSSFELSQPSPPYHSGFSPSSTRSSAHIRPAFTQPSLAPLPLSHARPSLFKGRNSTASLMSHKAVARVKAFSAALSASPSSPPSSIARGLESAASTDSSFTSWDRSNPPFNERTDRTIDTEREPFPDFQADFLSSRNTLSTQPATLLRPVAFPSSNPFLSSPPSTSERTSRFTEGDDETDTEDESDAETYDGRLHRLAPLGPNNSSTVWASSSLDPGARLDPTFGGGGSIRSGRSNNPFLRDPTPEPQAQFSSRANL